jgi:hypothetical protein
MGRAPQGHAIGWSEVANDLAQDEEETIEMYECRDINFFEEIAPARFDVSKNWSPTMHDLALRPGLLSRSDLNSSAFLSASSPFSSASFAPDQPL